MSIQKNTSSIDINLASKTRYLVQAGYLTGATALTGNFPVNQAGISIYDPNSYFGPTSSMYYPVEQMYKNAIGTYTMIVNGDWESKLNPGDPFVINMGSLRRDFFIQKNTYDSSTGKTIITFNNYRSDLLSIDAFVGPQGFPYVAPSTTVTFSRTVENPNVVENLIKTFDTKLVPDDTYPDNFSLVVSWTMEPSVKKTRLRWRSVPDLSPSSTLSFAIGTSGQYSQVPTMQITSDTGRQAQAYLTSSLISANLEAGGTGYTTATAAAIGDGTGASFSIVLSGSSISSIAIASGGTGYSYVPQILISGDGTGASASVTSVAISGVNIIQQGGGYLSPPTVYIDEQYEISPGSISSILSLDVTGKVNFVRILEGGTGYTGAYVTFSGGTTGLTATGYVQLANGSIGNVVITDPGNGYFGAPTVVVTPSGTGGTGASLVANVDYLSPWYYEEPLTDELTKTITGLKANVAYEIQILASSDEKFRTL